MFDLAAAYERYAQPLYRYARSHDCTHEEAQDLIADVFAEAAARQHTYKDRGHAASAWLYCITRSRLIDASRRNRRRQTVSLDAFLAAGVSPVLIEAPDQAVVDRLWCRELLARACLTPAQYEVLHQRFALGRSLAEIAEASGRSIGAIKALQHRAIASIAVLADTGP